MRKYRFLLATLIAAALIASTTTRAQAASPDYTITLTSTDPGTVSIDNAGFVSFLVKANPGALSSAGLAATLYDNGRALPLGITVMGDYTVVTRLQDVTAGTNTLVLQVGNSYSVPVTRTFTKGNVDGLDFLGTSNGSTVPFNWQPISYNGVTPTGTVDILETGSTILETAPANQSGSLDVPVSDVTGNYLQLRYNGDSNFNPRLFPPIALSPYAQVSMHWASSSVANIDNDPAITVDLSSPVASKSLGGWVKLSVDGYETDQVALTNAAGGSPSVTFTSTKDVKFGTHTYTASYLGVGIYKPASTTTTITADRIATTTTATIGTVAPNGEIPVDIEVKPAHGVTASLPVNGLVALYIDSWPGLASGEHDTQIACNSGDCTERYYIDPSKWNYGGHRFTVDFWGTDTYAPSQSAMQIWTNSQPPAGSPQATPPAYREVTSTGNVLTLEGATGYGSIDAQLNKPIVGGASTPTDHGYWLVASDGGVFSFGDARFFGSMGGRPLNQPIVGMASTRDGLGYWLVAADGGVFSFGSARFYGSMGGQPLNKPIVGMSSTPSGNGYWFVASDGGVFSYGDARFYGSTGSFHLNKPVVGMAANPNGNGYWLVASDGGLFSFGDAPFFGSMGNEGLINPVVGMKVTPDGLGYSLGDADGAVFEYGDAQRIGPDIETLITARNAVALI